jgi:hypothetical protein
MLDTDGITERIDAEIVSGHYFDVLGVRAAFGRTLTPDDDRIEAPGRVVVVSHAMGQQPVGASPRSAPGWRSTTRPATGSRGAPGYGRGPATRPA